MTDIRRDDLLTRITIDPTIFGGKPVIRGLRMAVEHVLGMLAAGDTPQTIIEQYPFLDQQDVQACIVYAHLSLSGEQVHERLNGVKSP
jgi:uncharacterized protein (DUF433 family)